MISDSIGAAGGVAMGGVAEGEAGSPTIRGTVSGDSTRNRRPRTWNGWKRDRFWTDLAQPADWPLLSRRAGNP